MGVRVVRCPPIIQRPALDSTARKIWTVPQSIIMTSHRELGMHGHWTTNRADPIDVDGMVDVHLTTPHHAAIRFCVTCSTTSCSPCSDRSSRPPPEQPGQVTQPASSTCHLRINFQPDLRWLPTTMPCHVSTKRNETQRNEAKRHGMAAACWITSP